MNNPKQHSLEQQSKAGFTLLELLIAMIILALIMGIVYASFSAVITSSETVRETSEQLHQRRFLSRRLETNLAQAYGGWLPGAMHRPHSNQQEQVFVTKHMDTYPLYWFRGENKTGRFGSADKLTFASSTTLMGHTSLPGHFKIVTIEMAREAPEDLETSLPLDEDQETMYLQVTESPVMGYGESGSSSNTNNVDDTFLKRFNEALDVESPSWTIPIRSLNIRYYDGEDWQDSWDSMEEERLPWMVELVFEFPSIENEDVFSMDNEMKRLNSFRLLVPLTSGLGVHNKTPEYGRPPGSVGTDL